MKNKNKSRILIILIIISLFLSAHLAYKTYVFVNGNSKESKDIRRDASVILDFSFDNKIEDKNNEDVLSNINVEKLKETQIEEFKKKFSISDNDIKITLPDDKEISEHEVVESISNKYFNFIHSKREYKIEKIFLLGDTVSIFYSVKPINVDGFISDLTNDVSDNIIKDKNIKSKYKEMNDSEKKLLVLYFMNNKWDDLVNKKNYSVEKIVKNHFDLKKSNKENNSNYQTNENSIVSITNSGLV